MSQQTRTTLKTYFNTGDQPTESQYGDLIDSMVNKTDDAVPKVLRFKASQSGLNDPTTVVFHDDFGGAYTFLRTDIGNYDLTAAVGTFPTNKTFISGGGWDIDNQALSKMFHNASNVILIQSISTNTESPADGIMQNQYFEVIVYP